MAIQWAQYPVTSPFGQNRPTGLTLIKLPVDCFNKAVSYEAHTDSIRIYMSLVVIDQVYATEYMIGLGMFSQLMDKDAFILDQYKKIARHLIVMASESNFL